MNSVGNERWYKSGYESTLIIYFLISIMGVQLSHQEIDQCQLKMAELNNRLQTLAKELEQRKDINGVTLTKSKSITVFGVEELIEEIIGKLCKIFQDLTQKEYRFILDIIAANVQTFLATNINIGSFLQMRKAYPIMTKEGFSMAYWTFNMEKIKVKKPNQPQIKGKKEIPFETKIVLINVFKVVLPPPPMTRQELGAYIMASTIQSNDEREKIINAIWVNYQSKKSHEEKMEQKEKNALLDQLGDIYANLY